MTKAEALVVLALFLICAGGIGAILWHLWNGKDRSPRAYQRPVDIRELGKMQRAINDQRQVVRAVTASHRRDVTMAALAGPFKNYVSSRPPAPEAFQWPVRPPYAGPRRPFNHDRDRWT